MPTYQNGTALSVTYNGEVWAPSETKAAEFFVPDELGLNMTSDSPRVKSPTLVSDVLLFADETDPVIRVYVPDCNAFLASIVVKAGSVELQENYDDNPVRITITPTNSFRVMARRTDIEALHIKPLAEAVVAINISRAGK